jgi:hypothetical protein
MFAIEVDAVDVVPIQVKTCHAQDNKRQGTERR